MGTIEPAVFDATVAAVPFLWELAATGTVTCRPGVIEVLQAVLRHGNPPRPEVQRNAHRAVLCGRRTADRLTGDGGPAVRAAAREPVTAIDGHRCETCRPA
ncbi:hypothetical protein AB0D08_23415 [Kitasatospora sp. NPDC048540]|uniref:hypothetical protein n=1 Tax=unclassified Kitasatospora TaxID=2633591 RepID=UPI0006892924|nr:hypothetical protein [Kitasatospora sp. MBT63]